MSNNPSSLERLQQLKAEIASLEQAALSELMEKRNSLSQQLAEVDSEIARLTGKPAQEKKPRSPVFKAAAKSLPLQELKELLAKAPDKTVNIRKEGLELRNIKVLAAANPALLRLGGKGAWPTVTLLK
jgi:DNA repair exonuclease SbcCD ATPase subunit